MPCYVKIPDIDGEVEEQEHDKWIEVNSVSFPVSRSINYGATGAQRRGGETTLGDLVVSKQLDSSSPNSMLAVANGKHLNEVVIHMLTTINEANKVVLEIKLKDVIITSYNFAGTAEMSPMPMESLSFNYTKIDWNYSKYDHMGEPAGNFPAAYSTETARNA